MLERLHHSELLKELSNSLAQFNIFEATGMTRAEIRHSHFLAFLLNPGENHGLGDSILRCVLKRTGVTLGTQLENCLEQQGAFQDTEVEREKFRIDILLTNRTHKLAIIIENKIDSSEHSDQLARYVGIILDRYPGWTVLPLFLTPDGEPPSSSRYSPISYQQIVEAINEALQECHDHLDQSVRMAIEHYVSLLRRNIVDDQELQSLAQRICIEHEAAIEFILKNRRSRRMQLTDFLEELIQGTPPLRHLKSPGNGKHIQFLSESWDVEEMFSEWWPTYRLLLFQLNNEADSISLHLLVGPGTNPIRERLLTHFQKSGAPFSFDGRATERFVSVYSRPLLHKKDMQTADWNMIKDELSIAWDHFVAEDLPAILSGIHLNAVLEAPVT